MAEIDYRHTMVGSTQMMVAHYGSFIIRIWQPLGKGRWAVSFYEQVEDPRAQRFVSQPRQQFDSFSDAAGYALEALTQ